jgi:cation diffusion facilitator family transporter
VTQPSPSAARAERRAAVISLGVGISLMIVKFVAYLLTGSAAIFSDALESIVNVLASGFALYAIVLALRPADRSHPYGHGKVEFLSAGFEGGMILLAAVLIAAQAVQKLITGAAIERVDRGLLLIAFAMLVNAAVGVYLIRSGRKHGSITLEADGKHLFSDAVSSVIVFVALGLYQLTHWRWLDAAGAIIVAVYISWLAIGLLRRSAAGLMDEQDVKDDTMLRGILDSHLAPGGKEPLICSYHKLRHRHTGRYHWVDFHIMVPAHLDVRQGHEIASAIEYEIELALRAGNATAHIEPCVDATCRTCGSKNVKHET